MAPLTSRGPLQWLARRAVRGYPLAMRLTFLAVLSISVLLPACGSGNKGSPAGADAGPGNEGGSDATPGEAGAQEAGAYPAFAVDLPQVQKNQGAILAKPVIVTVSWPGDSNASTWEAFDDALGGSSYWASTTSEYGVGAATSGGSNHVRMNRPFPASISYTDLQSFVASALQAAASDAGVGGGDAGSAEGGAPDPAWPLPVVDASGKAQTIYSLFIPPTSIVTDPGTGTSFCTLGGFGYHDSATFGASSAPVAYVVNLQCPGENVDALEENAAHETVEAATNPYVETSSQGYIGVDDAHVAWDLYTGVSEEVADMCQNWQDSYYQESGNFPYWVQRSWSNAQAAKGGAPCVPVASGPHHGMTLMPAQESSFTIDLASFGGGKVSTQGFAVTLGQPTTFQVGFYSDAPAPAWTIAYDFPAQLSTLMGGGGSNGSATVSIDQTSGQNGDLANVTVTVKTKAPAGFHVMAITWDPPSAKTLQPKYLPIMLVDQ
jgi:hypothetical protein